MPRNLYSPRLSDHIVRALYREARRRCKPMTKVADEMLGQALGCVREETDAREPENPTGVASQRPLRK